MHSTNDYYVNLNCDIKYDVLRLEADLINYKPLEITTFQAQDSWFEYAPTWKYGRCDGRHNTSKRYVKELEDYFVKMFDATIVTNFIRQDANTHVPMHSDSGTICSVNIILEENAAPITFEAWPEERWLLKYSIKDRSYEECLRKIPDSLKS